MAKGICFRKDPSIPGEPETKDKTKCHSFIMRKMKHIKESAE
jgi:hypothetical protein